MANDTLLASKSKANTASDSGSDSEGDDDFVPEPDHSARTSSKASTDQRKHPADETSDKDSDGEGSGDGEAAAGKDGVDGEPIDADELEALKREREEMVAAAGGEDRLGKRRRLAAMNAAPDSKEPIIADDQAEALKAKALAEWEAIKGSPSDGPPAATPTGAAIATREAQSSSSSTITSTDQQELVSIPTTYKFAGELHTSTRLLPRSHPDAIKHLSSLSPTTSTASTAPAPRPPPGPRRKKTSLAALAAAATAKPAKLNTLEKSKLDWDSYKGDTAKLSQHELDELEHQTKGGGKGLGDMKGYLERRDFLDRVKDRTGQP